MDFGCVRPDSASFGSVSLRRPRSTHGGRSTQLVVAFTRQLPTSRALPPRVCILVSSLIFRLIFSSPLVRVVSWINGHCRSSSSTFHACNIPSAVYTIQRVSRDELSKNLVCWEKSYDIIDALCLFSSGREYRGGKRCCHVRLYPWNRHRFTMNHGPWVVLEDFNVVYSITYLVFTATQYVQPVKHVVDTMLLKLAVLLFVLVRPGASYFNLFLSQAEVRKLMGKQRCTIRLRLHSRFY